MINKDTLLLGSFSSKPGNLGCKLFNSEFQKRGINAIYKSFKGNNPIHHIIDAAQTFGMFAAAFSSPYKVDLYNYGRSAYKAFKITESAKCGSVNTAVFKEDLVIELYNTDYEASKIYLPKHLPEDKESNIYITGAGGLFKAVHKALIDLGYRSVFQIVRSTWDIIEKLHIDKTLINCTPVKFDDPKVIDLGNMDNDHAKLFHNVQAYCQLEIYIREIENAKRRKQI